MSTRKKIDGLFESWASDKMRASAWNDAYARGWNEEPFRCEPDEPDYAILKRAYETGIEERQETESQDTAEPAEPPPNLARAEMTRTVALENVGKMQAAMRAASMVIPAGYRGKEQPLVAALKQAEPMVDAQGVTALWTADSFYVYLLNKAEAQKFVQSDNEVCFHVGGNEYLGVVQV